MVKQAAEASVQFRHLFTPLKIGSFTVRNRILSTAHATGYAQDGLPSERHLHYWASKARGGIGLIITEVQPVHPSAGTSPNLIHAWRDDCIAPFRRIVEAVHGHGARIVAQLWHPGRATSSAYDGRPAWSASAIASPLYMETPHEMTVEEIREVVQAYGEAARRMREAGLDGVEIHGAHGYLIEQFMSPLSNRREDEYGGDEDRRLRFAREVIEAVRAAVGRDYTVGIRISADQFEEGGLTLEDMKRIVRKLTEPGWLDYVNVSFMGLGGAVIAPMYVPPGQFVYLSAGIKQVTDLPVFCIGRINDPVMAEGILERHQADMVGMTRANIADPELPNKAREGRLDEIRRCIACNEGCWGRITQRLPITCAINPSVGREAETEITPAPVRKRVMVIGGGIAGMEAARVAALRGHWVVLYEKEPHLGGQLQIAAKAPGRADMAEPVRFYERQFQKLGVEVYLGTAVDEETVRREAPDAVIVATGGLPAMPPLPGLEGNNVVLARDVLAGRAETGQNVIIFATDQGMEGLTTADFLAERGKRVEVLIPYATVGAKLEMITGMMLMARLARRNVKLSIMTGLKAVENGAVIAFNPFSGQEWRIEGVDTVVISAGSRANDALWKALRGQVKEIYGAGECVAPRKLLDSTLDGLRAGLAV